MADSPDFYSSEIRNYYQFLCSHCTIFRKLVPKSRPSRKNRALGPRITAIPETDGTLLEAYHKYTSDCLQNIVQNDLRTP